ncbi:MAG: two component response regulator [Rhodospirillales bacterium]|nr:two component response regulator [Rhodospirillales bacterium]
MMKAEVYRTTWFDLQPELTARHQVIPTGFITAHEDETVLLRMLEQGAVECLSKPFSDKALLGALHTAFRAG